MINNVVLVARLMKDLDLRIIPDGNSIATVTLAISQEIETLILSTV
jgi:single-stranded DNA-binding protein